ncbi:hypothetical protein NT05HA_1693 [Aggregatibacter aphrophilus NJ8700]|nr:hypothetical protein NT05HA_1693 [Aggregatibacter aphrophilus NJ8700]
MWSIHVVGRRYLKKVRSIFQLFLKMKKISEKHLLLGAISCY